MSINRWTPKRPCGVPGCPNLCYGQFCEKHKTNENRKYDRYSRDPKTTKIYRGKRWQAVRKQYYESHPLCEDCLLQGIMTPAEEVHHIKLLSSGGDPHSYNNLRSLCRSCHLKEHHRIGDR